MSLCILYIDLYFNELHLLACCQAIDFFMVYDNWHDLFLMAMCPDG